MTARTWTPPIVATKAGKLGRDTRLTPPALYAEIERRYAGGGWPSPARERARRFDIDAAATASNARAPLYFSADHCALAHRWRVADALLARPAISAPQVPRVFPHTPQARVFCNPPYSEISTWIDKAIDEMGQPDGPARIVFLVPARTGTSWSDAAQRAGAHVVDLRGRVRFLGADGTPSKRPFEYSRLVIFERGRPAPPPDPIFNASQYR